MGKKNDLTNRKFGKLLAIQPSGNKYNTNILWECACDCGNIVERTTSQLKRGRSTHCGCGSIKNLKGMTFGKLTVVRESGRHAKSRKVLWECLCSCGNYTVTTGDTLQSGNTSSCGCGLVKHGLHKHTLYRTWSDMIRRCHEPNSTAYEYYGGRGIVVCDEWKSSVEKFIQDVEEILGEKPSPSHTLDRIDTNLGYQPDNVRWASKSEQIMNSRKRKNSSSTYRGVSLDKRSGKWKAVITINAEQRYLGIFSSESDAWDAYRTAYVSHYGKDVPYQ